MNTQTPVSMKSYSRFTFVIIWMVILCIPAFAFTYDIDEMVIPWGTGPGKAYTDYSESDWLSMDVGFPFYSTAWDVYGSTAYVIDMEPGEAEVSLIQYNFDTGQLIEESMGAIPTPDTLKVLGAENEYILIESFLAGYICYDYNFNKLWEFMLPEVEELSFPYSELYKLDGGLWGAVVEFPDSVPPRYELWKVTTTEEIIASEPAQLPAEDSKVVGISPAGEITWSPFVDMYGGVYSYDDQGNFERREDGELLEFPISPSPEGFWLGTNPAKPFYDGTVFTFEYTEAGIRLKRYTLQPESGGM